MQCEALSCVEADAERPLRRICHQSARNRHIGTSKAPTIAPHSSAAALAWRVPRAIADDSPPARS
eukprot:scaffold7329_cov471-Prasinococcus_capsulatus_cf.AAC.1